MSDGNEVDRTEVDRAEDGLQAAGPEQPRLQAAGLHVAGTLRAGLQTAGLPTAGRDPGGRPPAPGSLRLIQALVNTSAVEFDRELLGSPSAAAQWLATAGLLAPETQLAEPELRAMIELREAIRGVLAAHTAGHSDSVPAPARAPAPAPGAGSGAGGAGAASRLTLALSSCRLTVTVDPAGDVHLASADHDPFTRVIGAISAVIAEAAATGTWSRLKSCPGHLCGWAFYDRSSAGRSRWCSMQLCGSRSKMQAYRDRDRAAAGRENVK